MKKEDELLSHNYDGIKEYDNDLPLWWQWLFGITVVFALIYTGYLHFGPGLDQDETLALEMGELEELRSSFEQEAAETEKTPAQLLALVSDSSAMELGKEVFNGKCLPCHGALGQGIIGPNLTDDYWIHGGSIESIKNVIVVGVPAKGMIPWKGVISDEEIDAVSAYIWTLNGTKPPGAKAPEGELYTRES